MSRNTCIHNLNLQSLRRQSLQLCLFNRKDKASAHHGGVQSSMYCLTPTFSPDRFPLPIWWFLKDLRYSGCLDVFHWETKWSARCAGRENNVECSLILGSYVLISVHSLNYSRLFFLWHKSLQFGFQRINLCCNASQLGHKIWTQMDGYIASLIVSRPSLILPKASK